MSGLKPFKALLTVVFLAAVSTACVPETRVHPSAEPDADTPDTSAADSGQGDAGTNADANIDAMPEDTGGAEDSGVEDADTPDVEDPDTAIDGPDAPLGPTRYPHDQVLSPIGPDMVERMETIRGSVASRDDMVFMKVGASGTVSNRFMYCFAGRAQDDLDLDGRDALMDTILWFRAGAAAGTTPFDRDTDAAVTGRTAGWVIDGPLDDEINAINPRFALVNYGTNDMNQGSTPGTALPAFYENMQTLFDTLESEGIVPIVSGLNPREGDAILDGWVQTYDVITRGMAEARGYPYLSLYLANRDLPDMGLVSDGIHGNVSPEGGCVFTQQELSYNYNVRNLHTLELLDNVRRTVLEGAQAPDNGSPPIAGDGSANAPWVMASLPFTHAASTSDSPHRLQDNYPACDSGQNESGPEWTYSFEVPQQGTYRLYVLDEDGTDVDLHLLQDGTCLERAHRTLDVELSPGEYTVVVDTFVNSSGAAQDGAYLLAVLPLD